VDAQRRGGELERALRVAELDLQAVLCPRDPAQAVDEVHVPRRAAELAVGRRAQPDVLLAADHRADRLVLDAPQLGRVDAVLGEVRAGLEQLRRAQQAADVVGPEGGPRSCGHGSLLALGVRARFYPAARLTAWPSAHRVLPPGAGCRPGPSSPR